MTIPTPDEITAALAVLRRMPGMCDNDTLGAYARANDPILRMARDLLHATADNPYDIADNLVAIAARHGLRITTDPDPDPGKADGYRLMRPIDNGSAWAPSMHGASCYLPNSAGLASAYEDCALFSTASNPLRVAAFRLLPEGGQQ